MKTMGYAVYDAGRKELFVNTAHSQKQQAIVNGLVVLKGFITPTDWQYQAVRAKWEAETEGTRFIIVEVWMHTKGKKVGL